MRRRWTVIVVAAALVAGGVWALVRGQLAALVALVGVGVLAGTALLLLAVTQRTHALAASIEELRRQHERTDGAIADLAARIEEHGPLPPEHAEQLLRLVRASLARFEESLRGTDTGPVSGSDGASRE